MVIPHRHKDCYETDYDDEIHVTQKSFVFIHVLRALLDLEIGKYITSLVIYYSYQQVG